MNPLERSTHSRPVIMIAIVLAGWLLAIVALLFRSSDGSSPDPEAVSATVIAPTEPIPAEDPASQAVFAPVVATPPATLAEKWGVVITSVRLTAGGAALDVRYRVVNSERAAGLAGNTDKTYLVNQSTGQNLFSRAPSQPLVAQELTTGRTYFLFFPNRARTVKPGDSVALVVGTVRSGAVLVE